MSAGSDRKQIASVRAALQRLSRGDTKLVAPRVRCAQTVVFVPEGNGAVAYNFLNNSVSAALSDGERMCFAKARRWITVRSLVKKMPLPAREGARNVLRLLRGGFLLVEGTKAAALDDKFRSSWDWDIRAGLFHLSIKDPPIMTVKELRSDLASRIQGRSRVSLYKTNDAARPVVQLDRPSLRTGMFSVLAKRRTHRNYAPRAIPLAALSECLYCGLGITGFVVDAMPRYGKLPLKMTPSGGGRNPYEAYAYVQRVSGLAPGIYHYSAIEHSLGLVASGELPRPSELLGGQDWYDDAPVVVFLVAHFERTMWKYSHPMAYRAVLIEAGHIAQNMMIAAARRGMGSSPTALLADSKLEELLGLDRIMQSVAYVVGLGFPHKRTLDFGTFEAHQPK